MRIILDANFLVYCAKQKIDYLEVTGEKIVMSAVLQELEKLAKKAKKKLDKDASQLALQILQKNIKDKKIKLVKSKEKADDSIVNNIKEGDIVATMDRELKKRVKGKARILSIKKSKKLEIL